MSDCCVGRDVLGDLLSVAPAPCRAGSLLPPREHAGRDVGLGVAGLVAGGVTHAMVTRGSSTWSVIVSAPLRGDRRRRRPDRLGHVGSARDGGEVLLDQRLGLRRRRCRRRSRAWRCSARSRCGRSRARRRAGAAWMSSCEPITDAWYGCPSGNSCVVHLLVGQPVGRVLDALAALVAHHVLLVRRAAPGRACRAGSPCGRSRATARARAGSTARPRSSSCGRSRSCR